MASIEHCIMCFEALDAELSKRKPLSLEEVQASWVAYTKAVIPSKHHLSPRVPALRRVAAGDGDSASTSSASSTTAAGGASSSTPATSTSSLSLAAVAAADDAAPLFVTWNTVDDPEEPDDTSLRGCIGTFEPQPLSIGLPEYAVISAIHDSRFSPIPRRELPSLQAAVTLLTDFEQVEDAFDWDIGVHGIRLSFWDHGRRYGATYLPDVAAEQGWTKDETLFSLIRKAGWMGGKSRWRDLELKVTRYQGRKVTAEYSAFKQWRDWFEARE